MLFDMDVDKAWGVKFAGELPKFPEGPGLHADMLIDIYGRQFFYGFEEGILLWLDDVNGNSYEPRDEAFRTIQTTLRQCVVKVPRVERHIPTENASEELFEAKDDLVETQGTTGAVEVSGHPLPEASRPIPKTVTRSVQSDVFAQMGSIQGMPTVEIDTNDDFDEAELARRAGLVLTVGPEILGDTDG